MLKEDKEIIIVDWLQLFSKDIKKIDDLIDSSTLISISYTIFGEINPFPNEKLTVNIFLHLCKTLQSLIDLPIEIKDFSSITTDSLIEYCEVLYVYSLSCANCSEFVSKILTQPEYMQSLLKELYEDVLNEKQHAPQQEISFDTTSISLTIQYQEEIKQLKDKIAQLQQQLEELQHDSSNQIEKLTQNILIAEKENDDLHEQIQLAEGKVHSLEQQIIDSSSIQNEYDKQTIEIKQLKEELEIHQTNEEKLEKLESLVEKYRNKLDVMQHTNETIQNLEKEIERLRECESDCLKKNKEIKELQNQLHVSSQGIQLLTKQNTELKKQNQLLQTQVMENQQDFHQLNQQQLFLSSANSMKRSYSEMEDSSLLPSIHPEMQSKLRKLEEENHLLKEQLDEYEKKEKESSLESELLICKQQYSSLEEEFNTCLQINTQLQEENKRLSSLYEHMEQQWSEEYEAHHHFEEVCNQLMDEREKREKEQQIVYEQTTKEIDELLNEIADIEQDMIVDQATAYSICQEVNNRYIREMNRMNEKLKKMEEEKENAMNELQKQIQTRDDLIIKGKGQLEHLQTTNQSLEITIHSKKKEIELLTNKNTQLTRELFIFKRSKVNTTPTVNQNTMNDEYALLLKTNEELTKRIKELEDSKQQTNTVVQLRNSDNRSQVAKTLDLRIKELENENRSLSMNRSQLLQNKHILEQQIDEVVKESNKTKSENTKLKLHLQRIKTLAYEKQFKELQLAIESISIR